MTTHPAKKRVAKCGTLELTDEEPSVPFGIEFSFTTPRLGQCWVLNAREEEPMRLHTTGGSGAAERHKGRVVRTTRLSVKHLETA